MVSVSDERTQPDGLAESDSDARSEYAALTETVQELIRLMREGNVKRLDVKRGDLEISIASREVAISSTPAAPARPAGSPSNDQIPTPLDDGSIHTIKSPMIGTYYAASSPTEPPFVVEGDRIEVGQTVAIIEAMKTMNEIQSEVSGVVEAILVKNGEPVEYGHPLLRVRVSPDLE